ncbi:MAG: sensor histidine kinase [Clostridium sp.]
MILNKFLKKGIGSKVFLMNLLILAFIVFVQLVFQSLFFEKYYMFKKERQIKSEISEFSDYLKKEVSLDGLNYKNVMDYIKKIKKETGIDLSLRSQNLHDGIYIERYMSNNCIPIIGGSDQTQYKIILGDFFPTINIKKNDKVKVYGLVDKYGYILPQKILINDKEIQSYYEPKLEVSNSNISNQSVTIKAGTFYKDIYIEGKATGGIEKEEELSSLNYEDVLNSMDQNVIGNLLTNNSYTTKIKNNSNTGDIIISSLLFNNMIIIGTTPLTAVNDILGTMDSYYIFVFGIAIIFVGIISLFYSKFITKPLIDMSNVAKEISNSNFNIKYPVKTEDEIGVLGESLNLISHNLKKSLKDLKLSNEKLKAEMDMQKLQEEKRKELIANISHELKTPITIVQGSIEGLRKGIYTEGIYNDILEETTRMNDLVIEMLDVSKLEGPTFKLNIEPFDFYNLTLKEIDKLKTLIKEKSLNISFKTLDDELVVKGDEKRVGEVLRNLITNAIKYTNAGENITISIKEYEESYKFVIENFGVSLSENELNNIWEPFYRKEKSRNKKFGGTGLGLYIVKRILELHGSEFGASSTNNSVIFYFTLEKVNVI